MDKAAMLRTFLGNVASFACVHCRYAVTAFLASLRFAALPGAPLRAALSLLGLLSVGSCAFTIDIPADETQSATEECLAVHHEQASATTTRKHPKRGGSLPRFTESREAAALFFVKKHVPELSPFLAQLKRTKLPRYRMEIRYIFQVTELLADIQHNQKRHDLELKLWIAQNKARVLAAQLGSGNSPKKKSLMAALSKLAEQMVQLDMEVLKLKEKELGQQLKKVKQRLKQRKLNPRAFIQKKLDSILRPVSEVKSKDS